MGITVTDRHGDVAATVIPSVGCPLGCNFCSTSAMFGGKGNCVNFYETGDELFDVMCQLERSMNARSFFVMDENFLFHRKRALRLLELMEEHGKSWSLYVFTSANVLRSYTIEQLVRLGISWVWMGIEGRDSQYDKLKGIDTFALVAELQSHGIRVLGSTIIGLENHTPENIDAAIEHAARHDTDFHQFMLYTPIPGTPLHAELTAKGLMKDESEYHLSDIHGQLIFNYRHPAISDEQSAQFMLRAFERDFAQRPEHDPHHPHHAGRLAALQESPGQVRSQSLRLGGAGDRHHLRGAHRGREALLSQKSRDAEEDIGAAERHLRRIRLEVAGVVHDWRAVRNVENPPRGKTPRRGLDLRTQDLVRAQRRRDRPPRSRSRPLRHAAGRGAKPRAAAAAIGHH